MYRHTQKEILINSQARHSSIKLKEEACNNRFQELNARDVAIEKKETELDELKQSQFHEIEKRMQEVEDRSNEVEDHRDCSNIQEEILIF